MDRAAEDNAMANPMDQLRSIGPRSFPLEMEHSAALGV